MEKTLEIILTDTTLKLIALGLVLLITAMLITFFIQYNLDRAKGRHARFFWFEVNGTQKPKDEKQNTQKNRTNANGKNINTGTNHGIIGDQYTGLKQREITQEDVDFLTNEIAKFSQKNSEKINKLHITIGYPHCKETTYLAQKTHQLLTLMGFKHIETLTLQTFGRTGKTFGVSNAPDNSIMVEIYPPDNVQ